MFHQFWNDFQEASIKDTVKICDQKSACQQNIEDKHRDHKLWLRLWKRFLIELLYILWSFYVTISFFIPWAKKIRNWM